MFFMPNRIWACFEYENDQVRVQRIRRQRAREVESLMSWETDEKKIILVKIKVRVQLNVSISQDFIGFGIHGWKKEREKKTRIA